MYSDAQIKVANSFNFEPYSDVILKIIVKNISNPESIRYDVPYIIRLL